MSVTATNGTPLLTYQWQESDDNGVGDAWANAVGGSGSTTSSYYHTCTHGDTLLQGIGKCIRQRMCDSHE